MGVDVLLYAAGTVTDEEMATAADYLKERCSIAADWGSDGIFHRGYVGEERVEFATGSRYYGPGYERGDWPSIYGAIRLMQRVFPGRPVFYGGDTQDEGDECTNRFLADMWEHFLGPDGDDYRTRLRARAGASTGA